jgi:hypothetical protein
MNTTEKTIPCDIPYLYANRDHENYWKQKLAHDSKFKIGICWQGNPNYSTHALRATVAAKSIPLTEFKPLMNLPNISVYSLQQMTGIEQVTLMDHDTRLITFDASFDRTNGRFMDTAAVIKQLDLIITVDTAIAHLAGGLGVPTWILLPNPPDWRWMINRTDSPWYPENVRLFRQQKTGDWKSVIHTVTHELKKLGNNITNSSKIIDNNKHITAELSAGELIDKITILKIKSARIQDMHKQKNITRELTSLLNTKNTDLTSTTTLESLTDCLLDINSTLWYIEDDIRIKEKKQEFDEEFIALARNVYKTNDMRAQIKKEIDTLCHVYFYLKALHKLCMLRHYN